MRRRDRPFACFSQRSDRRGRRLGQCNAASRCRAALERVPARPGVVPSWTATGADRSNAPNRAGAAWRLAMRDGLVERARARSRARAATRDDLAVEHASFGSACASLLSSGSIVQRFSPARLCRRAVSRCERRSPEAVPLGLEEEAGFGGQGLVDPASSARSAARHLR